MKFSISAGKANDRVVIKGAVEDGADQELNEMLKEAKATALVLDCKELHRINSIGVSLWIAAFERARPKRALTLENCSTVFIHYLNMLPQFGCGGRVVSFHVPYRCQNAKCRADAELLFKAEGLAVDSELGPKPCPACKGSMEPSVEVEDYLGFLAHQKPD